MNKIRKIEEQLHRIKVKLFPNYLPGREGTFFAKTENEKVLTIENVCSALYNRGGFTGNYQTLIENVKQFYDELAYQLCDGFAVDTGYYSIHPDVAGSFDTTWKGYDKKMNPIRFKFRTRSTLRNLANHIEVIITGTSESNAIIHEFVDNYENSKNTLFVPGNIFTLYGNKIKITDDDPDCGIFFVPVDDPAKAVKVNHIVENFPTKVIGEAPNTEHWKNRIEIRTKYSGSTSMLKKARVIVSPFVLESA